MPPSLWQTMPLFARRLLLSVAVALAYAFTGWLSLRITVAPHYVSLVFLPAGVALGAALVWGRWALPGVWLGALVVQVVAIGQSVPAGNWPLTLWVSPVAAALQAWATAWAARRWLGYPEAFDNPRRILVLLLVLVPLGHVLNAGVSVPLLGLSGLLAEHELLWSLLTWWQGDVMGALLLTPLVLVALGQPADMWRHRWRTVALPMLAALAVVMVAFVQVQSSEQLSLSQRFHQEAVALTERLQRRLHAQTDAVLSVTRLMELTPSRSAAEFDLATSLWLRRYQGTQNIGWSPLVTADGRDEFERRISADMGQRYEIQGRDVSGALFRALPADTYLPIVFVQPMESNRQVLGLDVQVLPATARAVRATVATGLPQVTEGIRLVQESGEQRGVVMYQAAFAPDMDRTARPNVPPLGVVSAVFRMDDVMQAALGDRGRHHLDWCLVDPGAATGNQRLSGAQGCGGDDAASARYFSSLPVSFGERTWLLQVRSGPQFEQAARGWVAWGILSVSLLAVAMLGAFLMVLSGHARRTEQLVEARTRELAQSNAGLHQLAMFDPLTHLANRLHWLSEAEKALASARRHGDQLAVAFVDLDHFKDINDSQGHSAGDVLLQSVARRLQGCVRAHDLLARQGGDEFVVLLTRLRSRDDAAALVAKMVKALDAPCTVQGREVAISASVGLAWYDGGDTDVETLLRHADIAMYQAKSAGRNGWCLFEPAMGQSMSQRLMVERGLRRALAGDELLLHFQPQVRADTGAVVGVEALVRWQHPDEGLLMPDRFIALAEHSGQIDDIGAWVLHRACRQWGQWQAAGLTGLHMAVNVSAVEFARPGFVERVRQTLRDTGMDPAALELEITETALMQGLPELVERLGELADLGVVLALDDFGTGYSSLSYLKRLPLDRLKIDRSFVSGLPGDKEDAAIVRATLSLAAALGLAVVAEGVEHDAQREFLSAHGCQYVQGWLVARPMDAVAFEAWWHQRRDGVG